MAELLLGNSPKKAVDRMLVLERLLWGIEAL